MLLGLAGAVCGLETVEKRLGRGQPEGRHGGGALRLRIERGAAGGGPRLRQVVQILLGQTRRAGDPRPIARERSGNVLVGRAGRRALGVELRIVTVRKAKGLFHCGRPRSGAYQSVAGLFDREGHVRQSNHNGACEQNRPHGPWCRMRLQSALVQTGPCKRPFQSLSVQSTLIAHPLAVTDLSHRSRST